jgi:toxin-antitoxin system PIN domain toxin
MTYLVDVNVCLALALVGHVHHDIALEWLLGVNSEEIALCRFVQAGLLRLLTNKVVMGANVLTATRAWVVHDALCEAARLRFVPEPMGMEQSWREATRRFQTGPNLWTDAYLAAFTAASGFTLVTFDRDLAKQAAPHAQLLVAPG